MHDLEHLAPQVRTHASDHVFDQLARAILEGTLPAGAAMPPERVLVERFGVSRIIARQAVHRLAELGLVRVRQGGATIVLDPNDARDLRVLALFYRLAKGKGPIDAADIVEKQYLQGLSIVEVASRRAAPEDLARVAEVVTEAEASDALLANFGAFEERFWRALAVAAKNRIFRMEVGWWYEALTDRPVPDVVASADPKVRIGFYKELVRLLATRQDAVGYYLATIRPLLELVVGGALQTPEPAPSLRGRASLAQRRAKPAKTEPRREGGST